MGIVDTAHAKIEDPRTPAAQKACESCHGPSKVHTEFPMQVENLRFSKDSKIAPQVQNQVCLDCHTEDDTASWHASKHGFENLVCSTCHGIHDPSLIVPDTVKVSSSCSVDGCHADLMDGARAATFTHAIGVDIGEMGQMTCTGCHSPHGPLSSSRCLDCHAQSPETLSRQSQKAQRYHEVAARQDTDCIRCHKALSHPIEPLEQHNERAERLRGREESETGG